MRIRPQYHYEGWDVAECGTCGLGFARPLLTAEELKAMYTEEYFDGRFTPTQNYLENGDNRELWRVTLEWIEQRMPKSTILDVGCGCGFFLRSAAERGWRVAGFDFSEWAATRVRDTYGVETHTGTLTAAHFTAAPFKVVTLWSTLEHVTAPVETLKQVFNLLEPGGMVCVGVPNYRSWSVKLHGEKESNFKREHLYYFDSRSLWRAMTDAGFTEIERMAIYGGGQNSKAGMLAQYLLRRTGLSNQLMFAARRRH